MPMWRHAGNAQYPEHFYWRYTDIKATAKSLRGMQYDLSDNACMGTLLYLNFLQDAGLLQIVSDNVLPASKLPDVCTKGQSVRLIQLMLCLLSQSDGPGGQALESHFHLCLHSPKNMAG